MVSVVVWSEHQFSLQPLQLALSLVPLEQFGPATHSLHAGAAARSGLACPLGLGAQGMPQVGNAGEDSLEQPRWREDCTAGASCVLPRQTNDRLQATSPSLFPPTSPLARSILPHFWWVARSPSSPLFLFVSPLALLSALSHSTAI